MRKKKVQSLESRAEEVLTEMGSDPRFAKDFIKGLRARGVEFMLGPSHCRCFPRTKMPKRTRYGKSVCTNCKLVIDPEFDRKIIESGGFLIQQVIPRS